MLYQLHTFVVPDPESLHDAVNRHSLALNSILVPPHTATFTFTRSANNVTHGRYTPFPSTVTPSSSSFSSSLSSFSVPSHSSSHPPLSYAPSQPSNILLHPTFSSRFIPSPSVSVVPSSSSSLPSSISSSSSSSLLHHSKIHVSSLPPPQPLLPPSSSFTPLAVPTPHPVPSFIGTRSTVPLLPSSAIPATSTTNNPSTSSSFFPPSRLIGTLSSSSGPSSTTGSNGKPGPSSTTGSNDKLYTGFNDYQHISSASSSFSLPSLTRNSSFLPSNPAKQSSIYHPMAPSVTITNNLKNNTSLEFTSTPPTLTAFTAITTPAIVSSTFRRPLPSVSPVIDLSEDAHREDDILTTDKKNHHHQPHAIHRNDETYDSSIDLASFFRPSSSSSSSSSSASFLLPSTNEPKTVVHNPSSTPWWKVPSTSSSTHPLPTPSSSSSSSTAKNNPSTKPSATPSSTSTVLTKRSLVPSPLIAPSFNLTGQSLLANQFYSLLRPSFPPSLISSNDCTFLSASWVRTKLLPKQFWVHFPSPSDSSSSLLTGKRTKSDGRTSATSSTASTRSVSLPSSSSISPTLTKEEVARFTVHTIVQDPDIHDITLSDKYFTNFEEQLIFYHSVALTFIGSPGDPEHLIGIVMELRDSLPSSSVASTASLPTLPEYYFLPLLLDSFLSPSTVIPLEQRWKLVGTLFYLPITKYVCNLKLWLPSLLRCPLLTDLTPRNVFDPLIAAWMLSPDTVATSGTPIPSQRFGFDYTVPSSPVNPAYFNGGHTTPSSSLPSTDPMSHDHDNEPGESSFDSLLHAYLPSALRNPLPSFSSSSSITTGTIPSSLKRYLSLLTLLSSTLSDQLAYRGLSTVFHHQEMPLIPILVRMEINGIACDRSLLYSYQHRMKSILTDLDTRIRSYIPGGPSVVQNFNILSPKQLSELLFTTLRIPPPQKRTQAYNKNAPKNGHKHISTDEATLEQLIHTHPIIDLILQYRRAAKVDNTYLSGLYDVAVPFDTAYRQHHGLPSQNHPPLSLSSIPLVNDLGFLNPSFARIHTQFRQCSTGTGRLSSAEPNLQNIPSSSSIDDNQPSQHPEEEKEEDQEKEETLNGNATANPTVYHTDFSLRKAFVSSGNQCILLSFDYSQIEMRVLAQVTGDPGLIAIFQGASKASFATASRLSSSSSSTLSSSSPQTSSDIYSMMAAHVFHQSVTSITEAQRKQAKTCVLGLVYGIGAHETARKLDITVPEAHRLHNSFLSRFPKLATFLHSTAIQFAKRYGHVITLTGRRRLLPDIHDTNSTKGSYAARQAVNTIIQGSAADIIKQAMLAVSTTNNGSNTSNVLPGRLLLQIHDELIFECPDNPSVIRTLVNRVEEIMTQDVPLRIEKLLHQWLIQPLTNARANASTGGKNTDNNKDLPLYATVEYLQHCFTLLGNPSSFSVPLVVSIEQGQNWGTMVGTDAS